MLGKKRRIKEYLNGISESNRTAFDELLDDYLNGSLGKWLSDHDFKRHEIHIDWTSDYKCIDIQGKRGKNYVNIQIEPSMFRISCDEDEPEEYEEFMLESKDVFYDRIQ